MLPTEDMLSQLQSLKHENDALHRMIARLTEENFQLQNDLVHYENIFDERSRDVLTDPSIYML